MHHGTDGTRVHKVGTLVAVDWDGGAARKENGGIFLDTELDAKFAALFVCLGLKKVD